MMGDVVIYDTYTTVSIGEFLDDMRLNYPEIPDGWLSNAVVNAAIEFSKRTHVLQRTIKIVTQECVRNYSLEPPDCTEIVAMHRVRTACGKVIRLATPASKMCSTLAWWEKPNEFVLSSSPCDGTEYYIDVSVRPGQDACELPSELYDEYKQAIIHGANASLFAVARQPWSSKQHAEYHRRAFEEAIRDAGVNRLLGGQLGTRQIKHLYTRHIGGRNRVM